MPVDRVKSNPASLLNAVHPEDRDFLINSFKEFLKGNKKENIEFRIQLEDGKIKWVNLSTPVLIEEAPGRQVISGLLEDITEVKEHYAVLEKFAA